MGLTGDEDGCCLEELAPIEEDEAEEDGEGSEGSEEDEQEGEQEGEEDAPQVAANLAAGKHYPLAHRCLSAHEFALVDQCESVLTPSHECVMLMQKGSGVDPGTSALLAASAAKQNEIAKLHVVSGSEGNEVWKEVPGATLNSMFRTYRKVFRTHLSPSPSPPPSPSHSSPPALHHPHPHPHPYPHPHPHSHPHPLRTLTLTLTRCSAHTVRCSLMK